MVVNRLQTGKIQSIQVSQGGVPKNYVFVVTVMGDRIEGDDQANKKYHGGPDRAVCLFSQERIDALRAEGHPISRRVRPVKT